MIPLRLVLVIGAAALPICTATAEAVVAGDPWAIGYGGQVARNCSGWQLERQEVLAERGVLPRMKPGSDMLAMNGTFQKLYYEGQEAAETDRGRTRDFQSQRVAAGVGWRACCVGRISALEAAWRGQSAPQVIRDVVDAAHAAVCVHREAR